MPNPNKNFSSTTNVNFNLLLYINLIIAFAGSIFLAWKEVHAGFIYTIMMLSVVAGIVLVKFFVKDEKTLGNITRYVKIPFAKSLGIAAIFYLVGWLVPITIQLILKIFKSSFSITSLSVPLFANNIDTAWQSFSAAEIGSSMPWKIFTVVFTAGNVETFVYNFGTIIIGALIGIGLLQLISNGKDLKVMSKKSFVILVAFVFSTLTFVLSHMMNATYNTQAFIFAGLFLLISNVSIYLAGIFLSFWAGYHQSNNLMYMIQTEGFSSVMQGFLSLFGVIFVAIFGLIIFYVLRNWQSIKTELRKVFD